MDKKDGSDPEVDAWQRRHDCAKTCGQVSLFAFLTMLAAAFVAGCSLYLGISAAWRGQSSEGIMSLCLVAALVTVGSSLIAVVSGIIAISKGNTGSVWIVALVIAFYVLVLSNIGSFL